MFKRHRQVKQWMLSLLFVLSLLIGLGVGQLRPGFGAIANAQATNAERLMQQGVESYHSNDFSAAIKAWQAALALYQADRNLQQVAMALENLARAYQALDQTSAELQSWQQAESAYRQAGNMLHA